MRSSAKNHTPGPRDSNTAEVGERKGQEARQEEELFETERLFYSVHTTARNAKRIKAVAT